MAIDPTLLPNSADDPAIGLLRLQVRAHPNDMRMLFDLGAGLAQRGRFGDAELIFIQVVERAPKVAAGHYALGRCRVALGDGPGATQALSAAVHLAPQQAAYWLEYGNALLASDRLGEAESAYRQAVSLAPQEQNHAVNLAGCLARMGRAEEALQLIDSAVAAKPGDAQLLYNRARILSDLGRDQAASTDLQAALALQPDFAIAATNLGNALTRIGRFEEALAAYGKALALRPQDGETIYNRAHLLLMMGNFENGWRDYEARFQRRSVRTRSPPFALWQGQDLAGKTLYLYAEQGLGDTLQFVRYVPILAARGASIVLEVQPPLKALLASMAGAHTVLAAGEMPPPCDFALPMLSLPHRLGTTLANVPADVPYIAAQPARVEQWRAWLAPHPGLRVGIAWQGNASYRSDRSRSLPLQNFRALADVPGVRLVSLQKGAGSEQLMGWKGGQAPLEPALDRDGAFLDTAALMESLDLVIAPNTAIAHLAGATGCKTWIVLPTVPDWRWMRERTDSPWYPTAQLFRQTELGDWSALFARLAGELAPLAAAEKDGVMIIDIPGSPGELIDKITILELKSRHFTDPGQRKIVARQLAALRALWRGVAVTPAISRAIAALRRANAALWDIEEELRALEQHGDFGARFIAAARAVYRNNDKRAAAKRKIDAALGALMIEQKSYSTGAAARPRTKARKKK